MCSMLKTPLDPKVCFLAFPPIDHAYLMVRSDVTRYVCREPVTE